MEFPRPARYLDWRCLDPGCLRLALGCGVPELVLFRVRNEVFVEKDLSDLVGFLWLSVLSALESLLRIGLKMK